MDSSRFQQFYETHFDKIYRFVILRVGDRALAEDLVSEIFMKALRAFDSYDEARSKSSWIYTITRNHLANHYRTAGRVVTEEDIEDLAIPAKDFAESATVHYDVQTMLSMLDTLPKEKQVLIRMKYLEELSYEEMAERLRKEKGALKVATFRAMQELRKLLEGKL
jgi:RNA polymerase sigma-70 factor (ECF subfamily)